MESISLTNLEPDVLVQLGYADPRVAPTNAAVAWVKSHVPAVDVPSLAQVRGSLPPQLAQRLPKDFEYRQYLTPKMIGIASAALVALHLCFSLVFSMVCRNAQAQASPLIWAPILQFVPILKAAKMSPWWLLALLVPVLNLVVMVLWCFKIVRACGMGLGVAVLLLIPVVNFFALLYLAYPRRIEAGPAKAPSRKIQIMSMEAT